MLERSRAGSRELGIVASVLALAGSLLLPAFARCEVMDKEPTVAALWWTTAVGGLAGVVLWRRSRWAGLASLIVTALLSAETHRELRDPFVGPAILREAGPRYEHDFWLALGTFVALQGLGVLWWGRTRAGRSDTAE